MIPIPTLDDLRANVRTASAAARLKAGSIAAFSADRPSVLKSFWFVAPYLVLFVWAYNLALPLMREAGPGAGDQLAILFYFVASWLIFPIALLLLPAMRERRAQVMRYITAHNWTICWLFYVGFIAIIIAGMFIGNITVALTIVFALVTYYLMVEWFVIRESLEVSGMIAVGFMLLQFMLVFFLAGLFSSALGIDGTYRPPVDMLDLQPQQ